jgi:hypothetical protein
MVWASALAIIARLRLRCALKGRKRALPMIRIAISRLGPALAVRVCAIVCGAVCLFIIIGGLAISWGTLPISWYGRGALGAQLGALQGRILMCVLIAKPLTG